MNRKKRYGLIQYVTAVVLTVTTLVTSVPAISLVGDAKENDSQSTSWDGTFESEFLGKSPNGWTKKSANINGKYETDPKKDYTGRYDMVISEESNGGNKSLSLAAKNGTYGYILADSDTISVEAGKAYSFEYAIKLQNVENSKVFYGGQVYVTQYDSKGNELKRTKMGNSILEDKDWESYSIYMQTEAKTTSVMVSVFIGGKQGYNKGVALFVDDIAFEKISDTELLNGDFESGFGQNDIYSWHLTSKSLKNEVVDSVPNYTLERETNGYHGDAVAVTKKGYGYTSLDSNLIKVASGATYILDYALKIQNVGETFQGVRAYVAEYDENQKLLQSSFLHDYIKENMDWTEKSCSFTPGAKAAYFRIEFWCAATGPKESTFTAYFDDVRITTILRELSNDGVNNGNFEEVQNGVVFDWEFPKREHVTVTSTFDGYNGTKGIKVVRDSEVKGNATLLQTNTFQVTPGKDYKTTYMVRLENQVGNVFLAMYCYFYDANGKTVEVQRNNRYDYSTYSEEWQQAMGYYTVPEKASTCMLQIAIFGTAYDCWIDDVAWSLIDDSVDIFGFDVLDQQGNIAGWTVTQPAAAKVDKKVYRDGKASLFVSQTLNSAHTRVMSDVMIPVERDTRYKVTAYIKSYGCNINSEGVRLYAYTYDKDGKYLGKVEGLRTLLNEDEEPGSWRELICGISTGGKTAYVRMYLDVAPGTMNFWIDDMKWEVFDLSNEYWEDFTSVGNEGAPEGWTAVALGGEPSFATGDGVVTIKSETKDDSGMITAKWNTAQEYTTFEYTTTYRTTDDAKAKITIKYYDYADRELEKSRFEKELDSTAGDMVDYSFRFVYPSAKYAMIELSTEGVGSTSFEGIRIVKSTEGEETEDVNSTWRGKWIWHQEDYLDSVNSTPRYFRYHFNIPDNPEKAMLQITADDRLELYVNGKQIVADEFKQHWSNIGIVEGLQDYLTTGENVIAIAVSNDTSYAGLIFDGYVETVSGEWVDFYSMEDTVSSLTEYKGWNEKEFDDSGWSNCQIIEAVGGQKWGEIDFDNSPFVSRVFEIVDYSVTEEMEAGEEGMLTMTVIPEEDITTDVELKGYLWVRNSQTNVLTMELKQVDGPAMTEWKAGKKVTVSYSYEIPDFVGAARYVIQLDVNQVKITNREIMNNKLIKATRVINDVDTTGAEVEMKDVNGTQAICINGEVYPNNHFTVASGPDYTGSTSMHNAHDGGICITRLWTQVGGTGYFSVWNGYDDYNWEPLDEYIYEALSDHPDTYLIISLRLDVPDWYEKQNPDAFLIDSEGNGGHGVSFASEKFIEDAMKANYDMVEHMKQQPYWNRVIGALLAGCKTKEWLWHATETTTVGDFSVAGEASWKKWVKEEYKTDAALQEAWNDSSVTLETVHVPTFEERVGDAYETILDPATQKNVIDYLRYKGETVANTFINWAAKVTEQVDDKLIIGAYYGYALNRSAHYGATNALHTCIDRVLDDENIDFFGSPSLYNERYDGEAGGSMTMVDSVLAHGKAVMIEGDLRLCTYVSLSNNFFTRDATGPTYDAWDSISQLQREFAIEITSNVGNWYLNINRTNFDLEQIADVMEIMYNENKVNLSREKDSTGDICFIIDEDLYENLAYNQNANTEALYWVLYEQRWEFARIGLSVDSYYMSDLAKGLIPEHKVYFMLSPISMDESERDAVEKYLKKDDHIIVWQYLCGVSNGENISAQNMSEVIDMDVKLDTSKRSLSAFVSDKKHWLTEGLSGTFYGNTGSMDVVSPSAIITDSEAEVLAYMSDNSQEAALAVKDMGEWTSVYSTVPNIPTDMIRNMIEKCGIHTYSENPNDVIYSNSNYVGINCSYGGEKTITLDGTYAVYDVFGQTTYSLATDKIEFMMEDKSTKLFRLTPVDKHVVYVDVDEGGSSKQDGYNEVSPGKDYACKIKAKDGYVISEIIVDGESTEMREKSYNVTFKDLNNSHFVRAKFKRVNETVEEVVEENNKLPMIIVLIGVAVFIILTAVVVTILLLRRRREQSKITNGETVIESGGNGNEGY